MDSTGNRNLFTWTGKIFSCSFESGKLINFDVNTGKIIWKQQVDGSEDLPIDMSGNDNQQNQRLQSIMPLFMSQPLVDGQNIIIASTGQPETTNAWLYNFNRTTGEKTWASPLPIIQTYAPVKYRDNYFVNSAVFLEMYTQIGIIHLTECSMVMWRSQASLFSIMM
jgi:outer membrane protein assembly factor BamB